MKKLNIYRLVIQSLVLFVFFQNLMNQYFSEKSVAEKGTLSFMKNVFRHRNVTTDVMNSFNFVDNFIRFVTEAYITYLALNVLHMKDIKDVPKDSIADAGKEERQQFLQHTCNRIVNELWSLPPPTNVSEVVEAEASGRQRFTDVWCFCGEGITFSSLYLITYIMYV